MTRNPGSLRVSLVAGLNGTRLRRLPWGNSRTTAALAPPASAELPPATIVVDEHPITADPYAAVGFTGVKNPICSSPPGSAATQPCLAGAPG